MELGVREEVKGINTSIRTMYQQGSSENDRIIELRPETCLAADLVYKNNEWIDDKLVRFGLINDEISFKVFFIVERIKTPEGWTPQQMKAVRRPHAVHEEFEDGEYFPVVLVKYNPAFALELPDTEAGLRYHYIIRSADDSFMMPNEGKHKEALARWDHDPDTFKISKGIYEVRDRLTITQDFIDKFLSSIVHGRGTFQEIKARYQYFVDIPECWATLLALWTMGTHIYQIFPAYPYIFLWAEHGSGKSRVLKVAAALSHMGKHIEDPSAASMFRLVDAIGATICLDEVDKMQNEKDRKQSSNVETMGILNAGYEMSATVPRYNVDKKMLEEFNAFSPKMLASNKELGLSLESRCLRIPLQRSNVQDFAHREPKDPHHLDQLEEIRNDAIIWAIDQGSIIYSMDKDAIRTKYEQRFKDVPIRLWQIMMPLLCVYEALRLDDKDAGCPSEAENLRQCIEYLSAEKKSASIPEADQRILLALADVCRLAGKITVRPIIANILAADQDADGNPDYDDAKFFNSQRVGLALRKYSIPSRSINGRKEYLPGMNPDARKSMVEEILKKFSVVSTEPVTTEKKESGLARFGDE
jgi:hypothetical protein